MKKFFTALTIAFVLLTNSVYADSTVLNLKMGKTTIAELEQMYDVKHTGTNSWSLGEMYSINQNDIPLEGLKEVTAIFDTDGKLVCLNMTIDKYRFDEMNSQLRKKYKVTKSVIPFVGNKFVSFKDGNTIIHLDAPHLSFEMNLLYAQKSFMDSFNSGSKKQEEQKKQREADLL